MSRPVKVVTWQTPSGDTINITPNQERRLRAADTWPRNSRGEYYCQVSHGLHFGWAASNDELGLSE